MKPKKNDDARTGTWKRSSLSKMAEKLGLGIGSGWGKRFGSKDKNISDLIASSVTEKVRSKSGKDTPLKMVRVKRSDVIKALQEVKEASSVDEVVSSGSKAKRILKLYRDTHKVCD
jgi:hypothetical protein